MSQFPTYSMRLGATVAHVTEKKTGPRDYKPRLEFENNESMPTVLKIFESFFFQSFIKNVYVCPKKALALWKRVPYNVLWLSGILFVMELVEGKDQPQQLRNEEDNFGTTVGLLLRLKTSLWGSARVLVLDSGFCVLKCLIELAKKGVYGSALIKKRKYWPK
ncbi:transposase IS4 [Nitzschia inconspicua]|uniref:Transposase IS4 n=1 Tax=Nitzschia inconspicua TaxID=303405 RepID=A0A9K3LI88_9STRA|nr:transposase IS4 [Nitzschia inconspicua]